MGKKSENNEGDSVGRPAKIKQRLPAFRKVVNRGLNSIICTDEELVILTNEQLPADQQISRRTFQDYKKKVKRGTMRPEDAPYYKEFLCVYKRALIHQKESLFVQLATDKKAWQKRAWMIERKFDQWNLKKIVESDNKHTVEGVDIVKIGKKAEQKEEVE